MAPDALNVAIRWYYPDTGTRLDCNPRRRAQTVSSDPVTRTGNYQGYSRAPCLTGNQPDFWNSWPVPVTNSAGGSKYIRVTEPRIPIWTFAPNSLTYTTR